MKKSIILISIITAIILVISYINKKKEESSFNKRLTLLIKDQKSDTIIIDISSITDFEWDTLFVFKPYMSGLDINQLLGINLYSNSTSSVVSSESYTLFVFKSKKIVVNDFIINCKDFGLLNSFKYPKEKAYFVSIKNSYIIKDYPTLSSF
jgi:hypothetical protein